MNTLEKLRAAQGSSGSSSISGLNVLERLRAVQAEPTSPDFLEKVLPTQRPRQFGGTSLQMTRKMLSAEQGARTEFLNVKREAYTSGQGEDFEEYMDRSGKVGAFGTWDYLMEDVVSPTFDLLSAGNYGAAGFAQELMRTGSTWEAFKQMALEVGNALPGLGLEGARRPSFIDVWGEGGAPQWAAIPAGLLMDLVLDPVNLIPGVAVAKGLRRGGSLAIQRSGPLGKAFDMLFTPAVKQVRGSAGEELQKAYHLYKAGEAEDLVQWQDRIDQLFGNMTPQERTLLGTYLDSGMVKGELRVLRDAKLIENEQLEQADKTVEAIRVALQEMGGTEVSVGLLDEPMLRANYFPHYDAINENLSRVEKKIIRDRNPAHTLDRPSTTERLGLPHQTGGVLQGKMSEAQGRTYQTTVERMTAILRGDTDRTLELDAKLVMQKRSVDHVKWVTSRRFLDNILNNSELSRRVESFPDEFLKPEWEARKLALRKENPGYDVLELKRAKSGQPGEEIVGAYIIPNEVHDFLRRGDGALFPDSVEKFIDILQALTNVWKGWATLGTGYISRNVISSTHQNWLQGVGKQYSKMVRGEKAGPSFLLANLRGFRVEIASNGVGRIPKGVKEGLEQLSSKIGEDSFAALKVPKIKDEQGKVLKTWEEIAQLGQRWGVPTPASRVFDLPEGVQKKLWEELEDSVPLETLENLKSFHTVDGQSLTRTVLGLGRRPVLASGADVKRTTLERLEDYGERMKRIAGNENPALKLNRGLAAITENQARWTLWLDRMEKGSTPYEAVLEVKKWHFDYADLTQIEKRLFRVMMPFYAWTRFNVPRQIMAMIENPGRYSRIPKAKNAIESLSADWEGIERPDYFDEVQAVQTTLIDADRPVFAQLDLPVMDLNKLGPSRVWSQMNPLASAFSGQLPKQGYSWFMEAPIERFPGEYSDVLPIGKKEEELLTTFLPPLGKVTRGIRAAKRGELPEYLIGELIGVKLRALDVRRVTRANTFAKARWAREFKARMKQSEERERRSKD